MTECEDEAGDTQSGAALGVVAAPAGGAFGGGAVLDHGPDVDRAGWSFSVHLKGCNTGVITVW